MKGLISKQNSHYNDQWKKGQRDKQWSTKNKKLHRKVESWPSRITCWTTTVGCVRYCISYTDLLMSGTFFQILLGCKLYEDMHRWIYTCEIGGAINPPSMLSMIRLGSICHGASCDILVPDIILGTLTVTLIDIIHNFMAITL